MRVLSGTAFLVAVDIRKESPTLGQWFGVEISSNERRQLFAPAGFARGFCVLSDYAEIQYLCTGVYNPQGESGIRWNDPDVGLEWPVKEPILSSKDENAQLLSDWLKTENSDNFTYNPNDQLTPTLR
jgi:dTDP-4-dehydrorhamnose 3,5-epimerase